jgi:hypothetical protein
MQELIFTFSRCKDFSRFETWQKRESVSPRRGGVVSKTGAYSLAQHPSKQPKTYCLIKDMSDLNDSLKESYIGKVGDALTPYTAELTAKGFDPAILITQLTGAGKVIEKADKDRKDAEKAAAEAVANEHKVREQFYTQATGTVSLVEGLLGKDHALPVKLRGLRANLIGDQNPNGMPAPAPAAKPA